MTRKKSKSKNFYEEVIYKKKPINDLIILSLYFANRDKEDCTFEKLIKTCFVLFPKSFSFTEYPEWPDSRKLDRPLRELREKRLITGNPKTYFSLTKTGKKMAEEMAKNFGQKKLF